MLSALGYTRSKPIPYIAADLVANGVNYFLSGCTTLAANGQNIECIVSPPLLIQCGILANLQTQKTWLFTVPNYNLATVFNYCGISIKSFGTCKITYY